MKRLIGIALLLMCAVSPAYAQVDFGSVTGSVTDASGALVVGASVDMVNTTTNAKYHATTNSLGSYTIPDVPAGSGYKVTFSKSGFASVVVTDIYINVSSTRTQNAKLTLGSVSQAVEVSAANSEVTLDTTDATVGNSFDVKLLNDLPVQVRDSPAALFTLQPGVVADSVTGARTDQTDVTVDGLDVNDITTGQTFIIVGNAPVDAVEEFKGTVAGELVSAGPGGGGQYQLVTRTGGSQFHGDLNEYHRDTSTAANNWFNDNAGVPLAHYVQNQFGGQVGGPILKDKAFFFFNFYDSRIATSAATETTVPMSTYKSGNVQYILNSAGCTNASRMNTQPTCIGTLTSAQVKALDPQNVGVSSVLQPFITSRYPNPNDATGGDGLNTAGYRFNAPDPDNETNYVARFDYAANSTMKFFARAIMNRENSVEFPQILPGDPVLANPFVDRSYSYVAGNTWTIGANKVNEFYYGDTIEKFNFPATYAPSGTTFLGLGALGDPYPQQQTQKRRIPIPEVRDDFNWTRGSHNFGFGGTFKFIKTESTQINDFNFVGVGLGGELNGLSSSLRPANINSDPIAQSFYDSAYTLALGRIAAVTTNYNYTAAGNALPNGTGHTRRYRYYQTELYFNDTWKISKSLTMTYGLHYQYYSVPYEVNGLESIQNETFDSYFNARMVQSQAGDESYGGVPFITYNLGGKANGAGPLYTHDRKDFAPRVALAYSPSYLPKTVFNAGAGIVYDRTVVNAINFIQDQSSFLFQNQVGTVYGSSAGATASLETDPRIGSNFSFPGNTPPTITEPYQPNIFAGYYPYGLASNPSNADTIIDPTLRDPYSIMLNAGIQRELPADMVLKVNYVGRLGRRLLGQADASQVIDFPDASSGQMLSTAFANLTKAMRAGQATVTPQPWLEDQVGPGFTSAIYNYGPVQPFIDRGDISDFVQALASFGLIGTNVGMASQFAENTFITNKGFSSYNGLLVTLSKNLSHGLKFDFNYTWSHAIDNTSLIANAVASGSLVGFICDATRPRECRGNADFDESNSLNAEFTYELPFGHGRIFAATTPKWVDEVIGGWDISGIPRWHSGLAYSALSFAFVAGFDNDAPAIFQNTGSNRAAVKPHAHKLSDGSVNLFNSSSTADAAFSGPIGLTIGGRNTLRGPSAFAMDAGVAKTFPLIADRLNLKVRADAFNVFNHPTWALPSGNDITGAGDGGLPFGQINATTGAPRIMQFALRAEF